MLFRLKFFELLSLIRLAVEEVGWSVGSDDDNKKKPG